MSVVASGRFPWGNPRLDTIRANTVGKIDLSSCFIPVNRQEEFSLGGTMCDWISEYDEIHSQLANIKLFSIHGQIYFDIRRVTRNGERRFHE